MRHHNSLMYSVLLFLCQCVCVCVCINNGRCVCAWKIWKGCVLMFVSACLSAGGEHIRAALAMDVLGVYFPQKRSSNPLWRGALQLCIKSSCPLAFWMKPILLRWGHELQSALQPHLPVSALAQSRNPATPPELYKVQKGKKINNIHGASLGLLEAVWSFMREKAATASRVVGCRRRIGS